MKPIILLIVLVLVTACKKESASNIPANDVVQSDAIIEGKGMFQNGPYGSVTGTGKIVRNTNNTYELVLDSFQTNNGPDLSVYLSAEMMPISFIDAGKLKSTSGRQVYPLAAAPNLSKYKYIVIHCRAFNHLFGYALLQ